MDANQLTLPDGIELPEEPIAEANEVAQAQPAVAATLYTRDSKKIIFPAGGWEMDQYGVSGRTSDTQATIVPHANVSRIVMEFDPNVAD